MEVLIESFLVIVGIALFPISFVLLLSAIIRKRCKPAIWSLLLLFIGATLVTRMNHADFWMEQLYTPEYLQQKRVAETPDPTQ